MEGGEPPSPGDEILDGGPAADGGSIARTRLYSVSPATVDFGDVILGREARRTLFVRNETSVEQGVALTWPEGFDPRVLRPSTAGVVLGPEGTDFIELVYSPTEAEPLSVSMRLLTVDRDGVQVPLDVPITGVGFDGRVVPSADRLDFGEVVVGLEERRTLRLTNPSRLELLVELGYTRAVRLCSEPVGEGGFCVVPLDFVLAGSPIPLGPGASLDLEVRYRPASAFSLSRTELVFRTCEDCITRVELEAIAGEVGVQCEPAPLDFGLVGLGDRVTRTVTCTNSYRGPRELLGWSVAAGSSGSIAVSPSTSITLPPRGAQDIDVGFQPTAEGRAAARLEVQVVDPSVPPVVVEVQGTGSSDVLEISPSPLDFGQVSLIAPARRPVRLTNRATTPVDIRRVTVDTVGTRRFRAVLDVAPTTLDPGASRQVEIEMNAQQTGRIQSALTVETNIGSSQAGLEGTGVSLSPCRAQMGSTLDFGPARVNRSSYRRLIVRNVGSADCTLHAYLSEDTDSEFVLRGILFLATVPPGGDASVGVDFTPVRSGSHSGTMQVSISDPINPLRSIPLMGDVGG